MTKEMAIQLAETFLKKKNPKNWDGNGEKPTDFDTRMFFYESRKTHDIRLTLSYEWQPIKMGSTEHAWVCVIRRWDTSYKRKLAELSTPMLNAKEAISSLLLSVCEK